MSSTLLKRLKAYKCDVPECYKTIYAVIATTAESNIRPIEYHNWVIATGMNHEIMGTLCGIANDIFNGNIHWNNTWGEMGICSRFMTYAEKTITEAKKQETAIPELDYYTIMYFETTDPAANLLQSFAKLDKFEVRNFYSPKLLRIKNPTVCDVYWGLQLRKHIEICLKYAQKSKEIDIEKFQNHLYKWTGRCPNHYLEIFQKKEVN